MWSLSKSASGILFPEIQEEGKETFPFLLFFHYPIFWVTLFAVLGFLGGTYIRFPFVLLFALFGGVIILQAFLLPSRGFFFLFCAGFWIFGALLALVSLGLPGEFFAQWERKHLVLEGYLVPQDDRLLLVRLQGFPIYSPALLLRKGKEEDDLASFLFHKVKVSGVFRRFPSCSNPGGRDLRFHFWKRRIVGYLEVETIAEIPSRNPWFAFLRWVSKKRALFLERWKGELRETFPLFGAILLGVKEGDFSKEVALFQETGVYHLFCVSGFHMALLGTLLWSMLQRFLPRRSIVFLVLPFTFLYLAFCGFVASALRAWIMASLLLLSRRIGRTVTTLGTLLSAFFLMFLLQPEMLFAPGAQLSFASTAGLVVLLPFLSPGASKSLALRYVLGTLCATFSATFSSFPFLVGNRLSFTTLTFLGNLLIVPLVEGVLFVALWTPFLGILPGACALLGSVLRFLLRTLLGVSSVLRDFVPHRIFDFQEGHNMLFFGLLWGAAALILAFVLTKKRFLLLLVVPLVLGGVLLGELLFPKTSFLVFDVGQGLACGFFVGESGIFIDTGGIIRGYGNVGESILLPFLRFRGIREVRGIFLTHGHEDHAGGVAALSRAFPEAPVFTPRDFSSFVRLRIFPEVFLEIFPVPQESGEALLYRLCTPYGRILICGDTEATYDVLVHLNPSFLEAEVLVLPHHGSYHDTLEPLIRASQCRLAIISVGENPYGHPDPRTILLLEKMQIPYFVTLKDGAVEYYPILKRGRIRTFGKATI